jgi:hypothetical protein
MTSHIRRLGRLFCCLVVIAIAARAAYAADPAKTLIQDTIYRADGSVASGTILISWPAFVTNDGASVAAGSFNQKIGPNGQVNIHLVPTQGATPAGTYYRVVLKLDELKADMKWLLGDGKPGCIQELTRRVARHERFVQKSSAIGVVMATLLTIIHVGMDYLKWRH